MVRFFVPPEQMQEASVTITGDEFVHLSRVLRLRAENIVCLFDGTGREYTACIKEVGKRSATLQLTAQQACGTEPRVRVTLYQGLPKSGKMETIIQKCVELGIYAVQPVSMVRCVVKADEYDKKLARYQRVAHEAAKQARRGIVPAVLPVKKLADCAFAGHDLVLFAYEEERVRTLKSALCGSGAKDIALIIGPEGGFALEEAEALRAAGHLPLSLGTRILRTETAGMAMLAMVLYELEDDLDGSEHA